jgi:periplasmic protein TonB
MKPINAIQPSLDDIVFEHRNKAYGAYELRTTYTSNLNKALFIGVGCFLLMLLTNFIFARERDKTKLIIVEHSPIKLPDEEVLPIEKPKDPEPPKEIEQVKTIAYLVPKVVEETENEMPPPTQETIEIAVISHKTQEGRESEGILETPPVETTTTIKDIVEIKESNEPFLTVEVNPSFMGGNKEMYKFLAQNLKYPSTAQRANIQGKVFLSFIIEKDGSITAVEALKGIGFGCDEEAIRVMKLMPKWIAGKQNGRNVRVRFTIPVFFKLDN